MFILARQSQDHALLSLWTVRIRFLKQLSVEGPPCGLMVPRVGQPGVLVLYGRPVVWVIKVIVWVVFGCCQCWDTGRSAMVAIALSWVLLGAVAQQCAARRHRLVGRGAIEFAHPCRLAGLGLCLHEAPCTRDGAIPVFIFHQSILLAVATAASSHVHGGCAAARVSADREICDACDILPNLRQNCLRKQAGLLPDQIPLPHQTPLNTMEMAF